MLDRGALRAYAPRGEARQDAREPRHAPPGGLDHPRLGRLVHRRGGRGPAIIVAALAPFIGGEPVSERRILLGSVAYSICFAATFTVTGFLVGDAVRAA